MEIGGFEPPTSAMRAQRSPSELYPPLYSSRAGKGRQPAYLVGLGASMLTKTFERCYPSGILGSEGKNGQKICGVDSDSSVLGYHYLAAETGRWEHYPTVCIYGTSGSVFRTKHHPTCVLDLPNAQ